MDLLKLVLQDGHSFGWFFDHEIQLAQMAAS